MGCENVDLSSKPQENSLHLQANETVAFNDFARKKLSINGRHGIHQQQQRTPSVTMLTTKCHPERFIAMPNMMRSDIPNAD